MAKPRVDAYLGFAYFMATWLRIRFIMTFGMLWSVVLIGLSAWQMQSAPGNIQMAVNKLGNSTTVDWTNDICNSSPFGYMRPFSFTVDGGTSPSYCPWPDSSSEFRVSISVLSLVTLLILFFETPLKYFARTIFLFYTAAYFAIFVLDADQDVIGNFSCKSNFQNTILQTYLSASSIVCNNGNYAAVIVIDLIQVFTFYFLFECWSMTDNLYSDKGQSNHGARPFVSLEQQQIAEIQAQAQARQSASVNPMQQGYQPTDSLETQFGGMDMPQNAPPPPPKGKFCFLV